MWWKAQTSGGVKSSQLKILRNPKVQWVEKPLGTGTKMTRLTKIVFTQDLPGLYKGFRKISCFVLDVIQEPNYFNNTLNLANRSTNHIRKEQGELWLIMCLTLLKWSVQDRVHRQNPILHMSSLHTTLPVMSCSICFHNAGHWEMPLSGGRLQSVLWFTVSCCP